MSQERSFASSFLTFLSGAAIGAGLALLFAPQTGKETRKQIKDAAEKASDGIMEQSEKVAQTARNAIKQVKTLVNRNEDLKED